MLLYGLTSRELRSFRDTMQQKSCICLPPSYLRFRSSTEYDLYLRLYTESIAKKYNKYFTSFWSDDTPKVFYHVRVVLYHLILEKKCSRFCRENTSYSRFKESVELDTVDSRPY